MRAATPGRRWRSASASLSAACGARRSIAGKKRSRSTRRTRPPTTTSASPTSTRASSRKRARRTRKRSISIRTICRFVRTTSCSRKSMTAQLKANRRTRRLGLVAILAAFAGLAIACGPDYLEIPIETPIRPKLDVSAFQRVLVVGFVAGGSDDVDTNIETVRLLRSQLRTRSSLKVIDADVMALIDIAQEQSKPAGDAPAADAATAGGGDSPALTPAKSIKEEKDLEPYERLFANPSY